ncbi:hypothetical protein KOW79_019717 [Hemibagrus wyckioides]|uniref:Protein phosphatase 1 regulatory subunit 1B n=2 Tax=Hemibagrus wyckioides TaxID=337641 RepID=A0A9D3SFV2_9TELE|nr:hypothetical protein KOW79_019717 [Hemibagrus wyckioides]
MEASEVHEETKEKKKIHFAVPSTSPTQLDPRQVEMIRRRRPTPATLFRVADQPCPEDEYTAGQWVVGENGVLRPKRLNPSAYQPPSLKAVQQMAEAHMQKLGVYPHMEEDGEDEERVLKCTPDSQMETSSRDETSKAQSSDRTEDEDEVKEEVKEKEKEEEEETENDQKDGATDG